MIVSWTGKNDIREDCLADISLLILFCFALKSQHEREDLDGTEAKKHLW